MVSKARPADGPISPSHAEPPRESIEMAPEVAFLVGGIPICGAVMLAPMAGYSDVPNRAICRSFGSAMSYTEFVSVDEILVDSQRARALLDYVEADRPMVFQLFGNDAQKMVEAARRVEMLGPDIIDVNMGCSTRRVSGRGAGVGMMPQPELVAETFELLSRHVSVPVTGKIRLGWDGNRNYLEIARIMEANGASMIAVHPRTKEQQYGGRACWEAIADVKQVVSVPVLGSGDVRTPENIDRMLAQTGCDGVMIGRGAIGNPWLFARLDRRRLPFSEIAATTREHLSLMLRYYGDYGLILFRKHLKRYLADVTDHQSVVREMMATDKPRRIVELLAKMESETGNRSGLAT
jgi:tRNA-dihydrouridine synthase B